MGLSLSSHFIIDIIEIKYYILRCLQSYGQRGETYVE